MLNISDWPPSDEKKVFNYLQWNSYRSEQYKLFYVSTPKVACTSLKWWFASLEGCSKALSSITDSAESNPDQVVHELHKVAPHLTGLSSEELSEALTSDSYFRFAVVRNPYKRIFSAWQSKLLLQEPQQIGPYLQRDFFHQPLRNSDDIALAFEGFLEHLASQEAPSYWDQHWTPQAVLLRPDLINYSKLVKIEESAQLSKALSERLGEYVPDPFAERRANESLIPYLPEFVTERSASLIRILYAEDFDVFGYDTQLPQSKETFSEQELELALRAIKLIRGRHQRLGERTRQISALTQTVASLNVAMSERDAQITHLSHLVVERETEIAQLNHSVVDLEGQVDHLNLNASVGEYDEKIADLSHTLIERDGQIAGLTQSIVEREGQITSLRHSVVELEAQLGAFDHAIIEHEGAINSHTQNVDALNRTLVEREGQISHLNRAVVEREGQISHLNHVVGERDGQVTNLKHAIIEREGEIGNLKNEIVRIVLEKEADVHSLKQELNQLLDSRSWRVTSPLRGVGRIARRAIRPISVPSLGKIIEVLRVRRDFFNKATVQLVRDSVLFDADYYLTSNPDVRDQGIDPLKHYMLHGWRESRNPSGLFSTSKYLFDNPDVAAARVNPLVHYLKCGQVEGRSITSHSAPKVVQSSAPRVQSVVAPEPKAVEKPVRLPVPKAVVDAQVDVIRKSGFFDEAFYLAMYTELDASIDPIRHYCEEGWFDGRNPSPDFDTLSYLNTYKDISSAGVNPLWHYVVAGASEQRIAVPDAIVRHEKDIRFGEVTSDIKLLAFYTSPAWDALRNAKPASKGNSQLLVPHEEFGFYDLQDWKVLDKQAQLAKRHGVYGFCFKLNVDTNAVQSAQPLDVFIAHPSIDFTFCAQTDLHPEGLKGSLAAALLPAVSDKRCIQIDGRSVVVVGIPGNEQTDADALRQLRSQLVDLGVNVYLIGQLSQASGGELDKTLVGLCDAVLDLPAAPVPGETGVFVPQQKNGIAAVPYSVVASQGVLRAERAQTQSSPVYHAITLGRDETALKPNSPLVYTRFNAKEYHRWLDAAIAGVRAAHAEDRRLVFVNAWNDWSQGLFLEPDRLGGFGRVNETTRALLDIKSNTIMPKVSVIVPNYNHERFLRRRLDSIYGQTYKNIEVILMDDCSSDQSRAVLSQYAADFPDVTVKLFNETNSGGVFRQWAKGIKAATGDLVWVAESDDYCDEHFLEALVRCFDDEAVMLAYAKCEFVSSDEVIMEDEFHKYVYDLECAEKWRSSYVETAHNEVRTGLGIKNTIPNASGTLFKRPTDLPLLEDESWLSMRVAGDWVFYLHILRGGKIAYSTEGTNFFRRYEGSAAESTYRKEIFYRELGISSQTVQALYNVPLSVLERCEEGSKRLYDHYVGHSNEEFLRWYNKDAILQARASRKPNVMVSTIGFYPGGAEILPIRLANEFKRQGLSVFLLSAGLTLREDGVRNMLRTDVPLVETSEVDAVKTIIRDFGVEALNTHQWHIQRYPLHVPDVFSELGAHVASLHGMIEHEDAFGVTEEQLRTADDSVSTWVYTAEKNLVPFSNFSLYDKPSDRFVKVPNGLQPPKVVAIPRAQLDIPEDAFVLCCVSRAIPDKGWDETIEAVERARVISGRDIRLILVGNGPVYDEYCRAGVPEFVYLAGFSDNAVGHYAAADMGIMLTKFKSESFPLTIVDCLFAGKPYIASDVGDIRNMLTIEDEIAGEVLCLEDWEVPIEKAAQIIAAFASDKNKHQHALALVKDVSSRYRIDAVAAQYVRLFERDIESKLAQLVKPGI
ncbi:glycoside hydrolase family 99-like domain-containing protein [Pseudomonas sp. PDM24]|uniref:glycoside hydrolase family 99-like domain-containing protein n=1 Tax=Pseudomonas sp. PDM24 TaxID=2854777 RepID=UPI001C45803A|nr:glycoside hydrolase family 99-like domain-containing protein [Pseudomonas sp. PDM24]MBV7496118.1 glycoside hydrolase family 99-like domain-containing protein [Pseudomonas sp. PDM24]